MVNNKKNNEDDAVLGFNKRVIDLDEDEENVDGDDGRKGDRRGKGRRGYEKNINGGQESGDGVSGKKKGDVEKVEVSAKKLSGGKFKGGEGRVLKGGGDVKMKNAGSSISEFVRRNVAREEEIHEFNKYAEISEKDDELEKGLAKIFEENEGERVDIGKLEKRRRMGILGWFFSLLIVFLSLAGGVWGYYNFMFESAGQKEGVSLSVSGPEKVIVGEDIVYSIRYSNPTDVELEDIEIKVVYPEDFSFIDSFPEVKSDDNTFWKISRLGAKTNGMIEIKGKMIGEKKKKEIVLVNMTWSPENSEASFRKEQAIETVVDDIGLDIEFDSELGVMAGQRSSMALSIRPQARNFLNNLILKIEPKENIEIIDIVGVVLDEEAGAGGVSVVKVDENVWRINGVDLEEFSANIDFKVLNKINREESLDFVFEYDGAAGVAKPFFEKDVSFGVAQNDFNVSLILNGSTSEQGADFGDTLNYSLIYSNQGEIDVHDVVLMAVVDGDVLDWSSFKSKHKGVLRDDAISWTFKELPELKSVKSDAEGIIDFSVNIADLKDIKSKLSKVGKYEIDSYAQYILGFSGTSTPTELDDTKSNEIKVKMNSDLTITEDIKYFNDDNIAVGLGPIPPQVGEETSYRVYWRLTNNLHKIAGLKVRTELPATTKWIKSFEPNIGNLKFDVSTNEVVWSIGDLPVAEIDGVAEFDIGVTPSEENKGKVMVLLTGTTIIAQDKETDSKINITTSGKTTKLDDDEIAVSDGIVK